MKTLNQLKIGDIVYDLAAKFDAEDNNIKDTYSTKEYVTQKMSEIVNSAPEALDTLKELAAALNNDSNFATNIITQLGTKVDKVEGKQLSTEDFTAVLKTSLESLPEEISSKYVKPSGGIPKTDLSSEVQASLNKADSAMQDISTATQAALDGKVDKVTGKQLSTNDYSAEEKSTVAQLKADVEQLKSTVATLTTSLQELKAKA